MDRTKLLAVLVAIQDEPFNKGRNLMAVTQAARSEEELSEYILAQFRRLPDDETKQRILQITRIIASEPSGR
jgi:hypothetical protein